MSKKPIPPLKEQIGKTLRTAQQEMMLTLPNQLVLAFEKKAHEKDIDPQTKKPFASFFRWLWESPPPGVGLSGCAHIDAMTIIRMLEKTRDGMQAANRNTINALIEDLVKGNGAAKPRGGDRRSEKAKEEQVQRGGASPLNGKGRHGRAKTADTLAARLAESSEPRVRNAWVGYLEGKYKSVTAAATACGMVKERTPLTRLKQYWNNATPEERAEFLNWIGDQNGGEV